MTTVCLHLYLYLCLYRSFGGREATVHLSTLNNITKHHDMKTNRLINIIIYIIYYIYNQLTILVKAKPNLTRKHKPLHFLKGYNQGRTSFEWPEWPTGFQTIYLGGPFFFCGSFSMFFWIPGSMLSCFSDFLLFCVSAYIASLLFCFLLSLLLCFSCFAFLLFAFPASLLFCSLFSLLLCFCTSVPFYFYYSTVSFLQSCVFAAQLPAPLLLCFLSFLSLCFSFSFALFCSVCILSETLERP